MRDVVDGRNRVAHKLLAHMPAIAILVVFLFVGTLYVAYTPIWQAPDEPAHYNYIRALGEGRGLPVMAPGDYDQAYLERLTAERFPPDLSIAPLEYEDHQPPLYYLLATPVYWLFQGSVRALRLFSLLLGGVAVALIFLILREFIPDRPGVAWLGGGLVAFIPQFVAMMASINNDALLLALLWLWLWLALRYLRGKVSPWVLGGVAGALLLTKTTGYGVLPLTAVVLYLRYRRAGMPGRWIASQALALFLPAVALGAVWWTRNLAVYGWPDLMGLQQHNALVTGQPRTFDRIAQQGAIAFLIDAVRTTFRSFWGQFGWMGVVVDVRIYLGLAVFSFLTFYGACWRLIESLRQGMRPRQRDALILLGTAALITFALFVGYNITFVQHQGRYLFPALPLLALGAAFGWARLVERRLAVGTGLALGFAVIVMGAVGLIIGDLAVWPMALIGAAAVGLPLLAFVPQRAQGLLAGALLVGLVALDLWCLFGFIVPLLAASA